jgi:uncharacterized membrane protein SpoIIM required for sporulation
MNLELFLRRRRPAWQRLETLLKSGGANLSALRAAELDELGRLYQAAANDLATAQREFPGQEVALYLNQLVGDAHSLVYRGGPLRGQQLIGFFRRGFPALYRSFLPYTTVAFLLFLFTAVVAFFVVSVQPDAIFVIEGEGIAPLVSEVEAGKLWLDIEPAARATAAGLIMTNNIQVMINTFAGGLTAGLFTLYIIAVNGLHLGAIFGLLAYHGLTRGLAEFIVGHGGIELSVIFLAGGCGLAIGDAMLRPGLLSRGKALIQRTRQAALLILGCVPLLIVAGLIEGFLSPSSAPWPVKAPVGVTTLVVLHLYWLRAGRAETQGA